MHNDWKGKRQSFIIHRLTQLCFTKLYKIHEKNPLEYVNFTRLQPWIQSQYTGMIISLPISK